MKGFLKTSEIGKSTVVAYRAKILGIVPMINDRAKKENIYSIADAERILAYKPKLRFHGIGHYEILAKILNNSDFRYNLPFASKFFKIKESKLQDMIDEYNKSGCFITGSKANNTE
jgi:hypothetical protein